MAPKPSPAKATSAAPAARPPVKRSDAHPLDTPKQTQPPAATRAATKKPSKASSTATQPAVGTGAPDTPPTVEEVTSTPASERRQLNVGVPKNLRLHRRAGLYAEDHGISRQDQVAIALDAWLRERGY